jgi:hypothetical protein
LPWAARNLAYALGLPHAGGGPTDYRTQYSNSRKRCSPAGEALGGGGRGVMLGSARLGGAGSGCAGSIGRHEVGRVARGRTGGVGGASAHAGSVGWVRGVRLVSWTVGWRGRGERARGISDPSP